MKPKPKKSVWVYLKSGLIRHVKSGTYYSRYWQNGKRVMLSLETDDADVARYKHGLRMTEAAKAKFRGDRVDKGRATMGDLLKDAETAQTASKSSDKTKACFKSTLERIRKHWPESFGQQIEAEKPQKITRASVEKFADFLSTKAQWHRHRGKGQKGYGASTVNVTLETLHRVMVFAKDEGYIMEMPFDLKARLGGEKITRSEPKKEIRFTSQDKITELFTEMRTVRNTPDTQPELLAYLQSRANESAEFAEFMAYSGARVNEAATWTWEDERETTLIIRGTKTEKSKDRPVPKIPPMVDLLARMKQRRADAGRALTGPAFNIRQCREALTSACKRVGIERWTHHTLRHLFATKCIEAGVDIPTISRWLGHADGGALAMLTYGHLRDEHSQTQAAKVNFGTS